MSISCCYGCEYFTLPHSFSLPPVLKNYLIVCKLLLKKMTEEQRKKTKLNKEEPSAHIVLLLKVVCHILFVHLFVCLSHPTPTTTGGCDPEVITIQHQRFTFNCFKEMVTLRFCRSLLGQGFHVHFGKNELIHDVCFLFFLYFIGIYVIVVVVDPFSFLSHFPLRSVLLMSNKTKREQKCLA